MKKISHTIIILIILLCTLGCHEKASVGELMSSTAKKLSQATSVKYQSSMQFIDGSDNDTFNLIGDITLLRLPSDSIFGGLIDMRFANGAQKVYDGKVILDFDPKEGKITRYPSPATQSFVIGGNISRSMINEYFLDTTHLKGLLADCDSSKVEDEDRNYKITFYQKSDGDINGGKEIVWIAKGSFDIVRLESSFLVGNQQYLRKIDFGGFIYDQITDSYFTSSASKLVQKYEVTEYKERDEAYYRTIPEGTKAPDFEGKYISSGKLFQSRLINAPVKLFDFWYMSCAPCLQAMPYLDSLYSRFSKQGLLIVGINSKDNTESRLSKLKEFEPLKKIHYPVIVTGHTTDSMFNVRVYPTIYMVDRNNKVIYSQLGFGPLMMDTLTKLIEANVGR